MSLPEREDELLTTLQAITDEELPYVLVGGWAVTAFNQRFSTDVDLVVPESALPEYDTLLAGHGYERANEYETSALYLNQRESPALPVRNECSDTCCRN